MRVDDRTDRDGWLGRERLANETDPVRRGDGTALLIPQAILDAGGESGPFLHHAIARRMAEMVPGQVLQIISLEPRARVEVPPWCLASGDTLLRTYSDGDETWFWIRKEPWQETSHEPCREPAPGS